jgi:hypothetical protein
MNRKMIGEAIYIRVSDRKFSLNILSLLQDFNRIVLDEEVLRVARMFREELVVMSLVRD